MQTVQFSEVLKEVYLPAVTRPLNDEVSPVLSSLEGHSRNIVGDEVKGLVHTRRSAGTGSRKEYGNLPSAGRQRYTRFSTGLRYHYGQIEFSGPTMRQVVADVGAFLNSASDETERMMVDLKHTMNRQIWNDAESSLGEVGAVAGAVITLANPSRSTWLGFVLDMLISVGSAGVEADGAAVATVIDVDSTAGTVTLDATYAGIAPGMFLRVFESFDAEITGIPSIVDAGNALFGIDGAVEDVWNAYVDTAGAPRPVTEELLISVTNEQSIRTGQSVGDLAVASHSITQALGNSFLSRRRYLDNADIRGGYKGVTVDAGAQSITLVPDRFAPDGELYVLATDKLDWNQASDWEWMQEDGAILNRIPGKDAYGATLFKYCELTTTDRKAHVRVKNLIGV